MLNATEIAGLQDDLTLAWHDTQDGAAASPASLTEFHTLIASQHRANFDLWHQEDAARDLRASDAALAAIKHRIDHLNQTRNDLVEHIDSSLLSAVQQNPGAALHSETPGLMIDRLSILALKIFHTREQTERANATAAHRLRNTRRLDLLLEQRSDLAGCLEALGREIVAGTRRFKLYRQLKMYNDPELNPVLYGRVGD